MPTDGTSRGLAAGEAATAVATLAAATGVSQAKAAYLLTMQMLKQKQGGALAIPLIAMAGAAIAEGWSAYTAMRSLAETQAALVASLMRETQDAIAPRAQV